MFNFQPFCEFYNHSSQKLTPFFVKASIILQLKTTIWGKSRPRHQPFWVSRCPSSPANGEAVAHGGVAQHPAEPINREHLVRVVVLKNVPNRPDSLLVLVQLSGLVDVVQALGVRGVPVAAREIDRHLHHFWG